MSIGDPVQHAFAPVYGKPCWKAQKGYSSFLTFEVGEPRLEIGEPRESLYVTPRGQRWKIPRRRIFLHGEWHLWIYRCAWSISLNGKQLAHSESSDVGITRAVAVLDGEALTRVAVSADARTEFDFDLGGVLQTWPDDADGEQWMLFEPSGYVLTMRADGRYSHHPRSQPDSDEDWRPVVGS